MLPWSSSGPGSAPWIDALFTATSAVCVTGLVTVDTGSYWSGSGQAVILVLMQLGGLGMMTSATVVAILLSDRLGMRFKLAVQAETRSPGSHSLGRTVLRIVLFSLAVEATTAAVLVIRFATAYDVSLGRAVYEGVFHGIAAFTNSGFGLYPDSAVRWAGDPVVLLPMSVAVILGGLGFPVVFELARRWRRPSQWSVLTRLTVPTTIVLILGAWVFFLTAEWSNPGTLGPLGVPAKANCGFFTAVVPRTAGFNCLDVAAMNSESWLATDALMFIGGGSAGTAGGIKVTTFALLAAVILAEARGEPHVRVGTRRVPPANLRQALAVALLGVGLVVGSTLAMLALTNLDLERVLFEVCSAFGTVGLSTGITATLPTGAQLVLIALMFVGRVGPVTLFTALAARERQRRFEYPEERTLVG